MLHNSPSSYLDSEVATFTRLKKRKIKEEDPVDMDDCTVVNLEVEVEDVVLEMCDGHHNVQTPTRNSTSIQL